MREGDCRRTNLGRATRLGAGPARLGSGLARNRPVLMRSACRRPGNLQISSGEGTPAPQAHEQLLEVLDSRSGGPNALPCSLCAAYCHN
jgi:hypothetical protein